jgi:hypothetical protein
MRTSADNEVAVAGLNAELLGLFRRLLDDLGSGALRPDPEAAREVVE